MQPASIGPDAADRPAPTELRGLRALVTGSATGIGRRIGLALAAEEVHVACNDRASRGAAGGAAARARAHAVRAVALQADGAAARQCRLLVERAAEALGGWRS